MKISELLTEDSHIIHLYHGGGAFTKWDPKRIGHGEGMSFLALGPGLYAGSTPRLAGLYTKYAGKNGIVSELTVNAHCFFDPRKVTPPHLEEANKKAYEALDAMGLRATSRGLKSAMRQAPRSQWQQIREELVKAGIDGIFEVLDSETNSVEYCIYNPDAIKKIVPYKE